MLLALVACGEQELPTPDNCLANDYTVVVLEMPEGAIDASAFAVNNVGEAVGTVAFDNGTQSAVLWRDGEVISVGDADPSGIGRTSGMGIDAEGRMLGWGYKGEDDRSYAPAGFRWSPEQDMETLIGHESFLVYGASENGYVVGSASNDLRMVDPEGNVHQGYTTVGAGMDSIGPLLGVNNHGVVAGASWTNGNRAPFRWTPGADRVLLERPMDGEGEAFALNDDNLTVGRIWEERGGHPVPAMWVGESLERLPLREGSVAGEGRAVNAYDEIVGWDSHEPGFENMRAVLTRDGEVLDLNTYVEDEELTLLTAFDINDAGVIVGTATTPAAPGVPYMLIPICPEGEE